MDLYNGLQSLAQIHCPNRATFLRNRNGEVLSAIFLCVDFSFADTGSTQRRKDAKAQRKIGDSTSRGGCAIAPVHFLGSTI